MKFKENKVLLVEDDLALGQTILELLKFNNYRVKWCSSGLEALSYLETATPDIIICDLIMPKMSGEVLFVTIREIEKLNKVPFIVITADASFNMKIRQLQNGVNDYINKPFRIQELLLKVKNFIDYKNSLLDLNKNSIQNINPKIKKINFFENLNSIIENNLNVELDIEFIANELYVSKSTLYKKIKTVRNCNTTQYVREYKIKIAIQLIEEGETNVQNLANNLGFNSLSYFSVCFKKYAKISPKKFILKAQNHYNDDGF
jgi:DNA-binding response OmpR family regulator